MKMIVQVLCLLGFGANALAGDGYSISSRGLTAILAAPEVTAMASPFYIESIRLFGEILPSKMTYILQLQREDLGEERFCLVVTAEGSNDLKITSIQKSVANSRLCH